MKKITLLFSFLLFLGLGTSKAQYTVLHNFDDTGKNGNANGANPRNNDLILSGNVLYGMTTFGGANDSGCIFSINTDGSGYKDLHDFNNASGAIPSGDLTISGNVMYGMTAIGGVHNGGAIFSINTNGSGFAKLYDFNFTDTTGGGPGGSLVLSGNRLYGMTYGGGPASNGTVFSINTNGTGYSNMYDFTGEPDGFEPTGSLTLSGSTLYGMTSSGGKYDDGCIFTINTGGGGYSLLHSFNDTLGGVPNGSLILSGSTLYGMTQFGGVSSIGVIFSMNTGGSGYSDIFNFNGTNGDGPLGSLGLCRSTLCGMTYSGGSVDLGNIFSISTNGNNVNNLYNFNAGTTGILPTGSLTLSVTGDTLYGMATNGGANNVGVIFRFIDGSLGINNLTTGTGSINVYPNPSNGMFHIVCHSERSEESQPQMKVYNVLGEQVLTETLRSSQGDNTVDITNQPNGVYLYRVIDNIGELIGNGKLIIQK